jgi:hypothetical protein
MTARRFATTSATVAAGSAIAGGLFWALLNVPESNALALGLSALLVVGAIAAAGATIAAAASVAGGTSPNDTFRRAAAALPAFVVGLLIACALWWLTGIAGGWWDLHRGETDALFIRYANITKTGALHATVAWLLWFVRWVIGGSIVAALVTTVAVRREAGLRGGLRTGVALLPIVATLAIAELLSRAWPIVYWRPRRLPQGVEPLFVGVKLAVLYLVASAAIAAGIALIRRAALSRRAI